MERRDCSVAVHRLPSHFGPRALAILGRELQRRPRNRVLVQYVPQAFGLKAMNLPFCLWLYARRRRDTTVMFHEVMFPLERGQSLRHNALGIVTRLMAVLVARSATRIFVSTLIWEQILRGLTRMDGPIAWLPVPSGIPVVDDPAGVGAAKRRYADDGVPLVGHFGTYATHIAQLLSYLLPRALSDHPALAVLLMGANSREFRAALIRENPEFAARVHATGTLPPQELSRAISACDLMVQPYSEGVSARRTCLMAALAHGQPVVTSSGTATEPLWAESGAVALASAGDLDAMRSLIAELLADEAQRACYSTKAMELYAQRFDLRHTVAALRSP